MRKIIRGKGRWRKELDKRGKNEEERLRVEEMG